MNEPIADSGFRECTFRSQDDLLLYWRDYGDPASHRTPVLCLSGLTRNSKDFHLLARQFCQERRVLAPDYRGRGRSARDPDWRRYRAETYLADILDLLTIAGINRVVVVGTSMGGLLAMGLAAFRPTILAGVILNDVGPEIAGEGYQRILDYIGTDRPETDWDGAIAELKRMFPMLSLDTAEKWLRMADASYRRGADGILHFDWDVALARSLSTKPSAQPDLWRLYRCLGTRPVLAIRGALSDVLSEATFDRMAEVKPDLQRVVVPNTGHVPALDEPEVAAVIHGFIAKF
jgi:pimeloyl-ACP methyl ester carboxylesterase